MITAVGDRTELLVRVVPGAKKSEIIGEHEGALKVRIQAPPVDGKANKELVRFLAREVFGLSRSQVRLIRGDKSRSKVLELDVDVERARKMLSQRL